MKTETKSGWKGLVQTFALGIAEQLGENLSFKVHKWINKFKRRAIGSFLIAVGITFFLNGLAIYINVIARDIYPWLGYGVVGIAAALVGYIMLSD